MCNTYDGDCDCTINTCEPIIKGSLFSVQDFLADVNNQVLVVKFGNTHRRLSESKISLDKEALLNRQMRYRSYATSEQDGIQQVLVSSNKGFLMEAASAEYIAGRTCSLKVLSTDLNLHPQSWAYPINSPIRDTWVRLLGSTEVMATKAFGSKWWKNSC